MSILIIGGDSKIGSHFYKYLIKKSLNVIKTSRKLQNLNESTIHFNLENPSDTLARLFAAIPKEIPRAKNRYPNKGFINLEK